MKKRLLASLLPLAACAALAAPTAPLRISPAADAAATNAVSADSLNTAVEQVLVDIDGAWARSTAGGQKVSGAYMTLTAKPLLVLRASSKYMKCAWTERSCA